MSDRFDLGTDGAQQKARAFEILSRINREMEFTIVGQATLKKRLIQGLVCKGHVLLEGVPGLAKTLSIKALAGTVDGLFHRIQFTPDLLPADVTGSEIYRAEKAAFEIRKGPIFANFVLADEINRAPAKVQSALLETMQEHQVTIGEQTLQVPQPFFVLATQNPVEQEGTYPLPEAQIDRFIMKIKVDYPSPNEELEILSRMTKPSMQQRELAPVASLSDVVLCQNVCETVYVDERLKRYIVNLVWATRDPKAQGLPISHLIELGASPRAAISLLAVARAEALMNGDEFVVPQHIKNIAHDVLRHRLIPTYEAEAEGLSSDNIISTILENVEVP